MLFSLFLSLSVLLVSHGLQQTLLPLFAHSIGWSPAAIGLTGSAYFLGFIVGCYYIPRLIKRVGHVRIFAVCTSLAIVAILTLSNWHYLAVWLLARAVTGASFAGLYMVLESWLNEQAPNQYRGAVLSFYGFLSLVAMATGQLLVVGGNVLEGGTWVAIIFGLAIIPVALTTSPQPQVPSEVELSFRSAYQASQVAPVLAAVSGFVMGLVWSNGAVYANSLVTHAGPSFIVFTLIGGIVCQLPIGRLSDRIDRRWILLGLAGVGCVTMLAWLILPFNPSLLPLVAFVIGATAMPMYSLAIAHANDNADGKFLVIASAMLVANGLGSTLGPLLYAGFLGLGVHNAFFKIMAASYAVGLLWTCFRLSQHTAPRDHYESFQSSPRTTLAAAELNPRSAD